MPKQRKFVLGSKSPSGKRKANHDSSLSKKKIKKKKNLDSDQNVENKSMRVSKDSDKSLLSNEDPFVFHFCRNLTEDQAKEISDQSTWSNCFIEWPTLGRIKTETPSPCTKESKPVKKLLLEDDIDTLAPTVGVIPPLPFRSTDISSKSCLHPSINQGTVKSFTALQREIFSILSQYVDFYYPYATHDKWDKIHQVYIVHCLNHVLKTSKQIVHNNEQLEALQKAGKESDAAAFPDQGFTRAKVLILLPFKNSAYRVVKEIMTILKMEVMNKKRFERDYGPPASDERSSKHLADKPEDFSKIFDGDIKEDFKIGLTITKKNLKLYSEFSQSDIIIGSPLGIRYLLNTAKSSEETDFLSSIEVVIIDQADVFLMQNWEHVLINLEAVNKFPKNLQNLNFDLYRVRRWCLDKLSGMYRQTICFSSINNDLVRSLVAKTNNFAGRVQVLNLPTNGTLDDVSVQAEFIIQKVSTDSSAECYSPDSQFEFFTKVLLPRLRSQDVSHTLIYVPDYCDYIRLVRYLKEDGGTSVATINEYMIEENSKVAKARSLFFQGKRRFLVYTERFHFYRRYKIKGIQHIVFYSLPTYPHFFPEICNFLADEYQNPKEPPPTGLKTITVPFQSFDTAKMVALLGAYKAAEIMRSEKSIHKTVTGSTRS